MASSIFVAPRWSSGRRWLLAAAVGAALVTSAARRERLETRAPVVARATVSFALHATAAVDECSAALAAWAEVRRQHDDDDHRQPARDRAIDTCLAR